jgi:hypothetical protein
MRTATIRPILVCTLLLAAGAPLARADAPPTLEELKKLAADKQWREVMAAAARITALKGDPARDKERPEVWALKAEAQIQTNQLSPASDSFASASKEGAATPEKKDEFLALSMLMDKSDGRGYHPKPTKEDPSPVSIDIKDPANRPAAIKKLFETELSELKKSLAKAKDSMSAMKGFAKDAKELQPIERAADGSTAKIDELVHDGLGTLSKSVVDWCDKQKTDIERIVKNADEMIYVEGAKKGERVMRRRGLTGNDRQVLGNTVDACVKLAGSYDQLIGVLGDAFKGDISSLPPKIQAVHDDAKSALRDRAS